MTVSQEVSVARFGTALREIAPHYAGVCRDERTGHGVGLRLTRRHAEVMPWHPGRCAELSVNGQVLGFAGELPPEVVRAFGLPERTCAVEFTLDALLAAAPKGGTISALLPFPLAKEDVALIVDEAVAAADVQAALTEGAGALLEEISLFDVWHPSWEPCNLLGSDPVPGRATPRRVMKFHDCYALHHPLSRLHWVDLGRPLRPLQCVIVPYTRSGTPQRRGE